MKKTKHHYTKEELEASKVVLDEVKAEAGKNIVYLLNPFIYPDRYKKISFNMEDNNGNSHNLKPTILGLIGFINGALHLLAHEEKINIKN